MPSGETMNQRADAFRQLSLIAAQVVFLADQQETSAKTSHGHERCYGDGHGKHQQQPG